MTTENTQRDLKLAGAETGTRKRKGYRAQLEARRAAKEREELKRIRELKPSAVMQRWAYRGQLLTDGKPRSVKSSCPSGPEGCGEPGDGQVFGLWCWRTVEASIEASIAVHNRMMAANLVRSHFLDGKPTAAELSSRPWFVRLECSVLARMRSHPFRPDAADDWAAA